MIKKPITDDKLIAHLGHLPEDQRDVFLLYNGSIRAVAIQGTKTVNQMRANHNLGILETLVLGHAYLAAGVLSSTVKAMTAFNLILMRWSNKRVYVEAWASGAVRGYLQEVPIRVDKPLKF